MIQKWEFTELELKGAYLIKPFYATDDRGGLIKDYNIDTFKDNGIDYDLKETFYTISKRGVIRSTHFQMEIPQPKLMRCISGKVWYIMVDLRPESETYGKWLHFDLSGDDVISLLVPAGFGQGYLVLEDSVMSYKAADVFYGPGDAGIMYNDPDIGIKWPFELIGGKDNLIISEKDLNLMSFREYSKKYGKTMK
jgi:dTDP-4-dehydrorhamnose 3,5-epimerase